MFTVYIVLYLAKGPHSRGDHIGETIGEECFVECWYFKYIIDIIFDPVKLSWISVSGQPIPGKTIDYK